MLGRNGLSVYVHAGEGGPVGGDRARRPVTRSPTRGEITRSDVSNFKLPRFIFSLLDATKAWLKNQGVPNVVGCVLGVGAYAGA